MNVTKKKSVLSFRWILLICKWQVGLNVMNREFESRTIYLKTLAILSVFSSTFDFK